MSLFAPATHRLWARSTPRAKWRQLACGNLAECVEEMRRLQAQGVVGEFAVLDIGRHPAWDLKEREQ